MIDWRQWGHEPVLVAALVLVGFLAQGSVGNARDRALVWAGVAAGYLAVGPPWEQAGRYYLFSVQMLEQLLLIYGAAAFLVAGLSATVFERTGAEAAVREKRVRKPRGLAPVICGSVFILGTAFFYLPRVHGRMVVTETRLAGEHAAFLLAGGFFWWPVLSRSERLPALRYGPRLVYLLVVEAALAGVFSYLLMAEHAIYAAYEAAPRLMRGLSADEDQVLAGVLLSAVGSAVLVGALGTAFFAWSREESRS